MELNSHIIEAVIATGPHTGKRLFIPQIPLMPSDNQFLFQLWRRPFPINLAFSFTANKSKGQTLDRVDGYAEENIEPSRRSGRISAGLWGWMAASGPGELIVIDERMNSNQYIAILHGQILVPSVRKLLLPYPMPIYIAMDNSAVHNAKAVKKWFQQNPDVVRIDWLRSLQI
ncbi:uncharacterized protein LOC135211469 [Macrobrachium nipponense]|uniref:uncharacterized protein LOC135211469 n=1 Tax=Macrobrachium nipponense TaxID=159736 RepID=UPI0030C89124